MGASSNRRVTRPGDVRGATSRGATTQLEVRGGSPRGVRVTPYRDGPLIVRGATRILAADGGELTPRRDPIALCRCGKSRLRPFCDGTHKLIGFRAAGVPDSGEGDWLADLARLGIEIP